MDGLLPIPVKLITTEAVELRIHNRESLWKLFVISHVRASRDQSESRQAEGPTGKGSKCRYRTVLVLLVLPIGGYVDMQKCQGI